MEAEAGLELSKVDEFTNAVQKKETNSFQFAEFSKLLMLQEVSLNRRKAKFKKIAAVLCPFVMTE